MIKKQVRFSEQSKMCLKIESARQDVNINAIVLEILKDSKNWNVEFQHKKFNIPQNNCYILTYTLEFRKAFMARAARVNEIYRTKNRITDEMIINQIIDQYYAKRNYKV